MGYLVSSQPITIQATMAVMVLREADAGPILVASTASLREADRQIHD